MSHSHRFRFAPLVASVVLLAAALAPTGLLPSEGRAHDTQKRPGAQKQGPSAAINGAWRLVGSVQQAQQMVQQAVEPAIAPLTPDIQRLARARIAETTWVPQTITIQATPARILITYAGSETRTFDTAPGQPENVYSRSGVRAQMIQQFRPDGGIEQRFQAMDGVQHHFLSASGNQMHLDVLMTSPRIQGEIRFRISYQR